MPDFLVVLIKAVPDKIHTVLTENGIRLPIPSRYANGPMAKCSTHRLARQCNEYSIEHRFTKINHPWTNSQFEGMNWAIKETIFKR